MDKNLHELLDELELHTRRKHPEASNEAHQAARKIVEGIAKAWSERFKKAMHDTKLDELPKKKAS